MNVPPRPTTALTTRADERATRCPACASVDVTPFYEADRVPVHSCVLVSSREEALSFPTGRIRLAFCASCGFVFNAAFDASLLDYSQDYEETQGFSARFRTFAEELAGRLIDRFDLRDKEILEIGCGKGEFLVLLCELGRNRGIGIDPAYVPERTDSKAAGRIRFIRDYYSESYVDLTADLVCCRHTLEHIPDVAGFIGLIRRSIADRQTPVFFEVPDTRRVLREAAFWDIYHEHCSYFTLGSLARLFRSNGFDITDMSMAFDDQYLVLEALPTPDGAGRSQPKELPQERGLPELIADIDVFRGRHEAVIAGWTERLDRWREQGRQVVVWGSGSKGVAFLTALGVGERVSSAVDVNPYRQGKFMVGTGHPIVSPESLAGSPPDVVIVMNPIYVEEIRGQLQGMGLRPDILSV
jgi:SAM-dependent methyltransferase